LHLAGVGVEVAGGEAFADQGQHAIGDRLAGQAGAGGAEGDRALVGLGCGQHRISGRSFSDSTTAMTSGIRR
jgi:hypothetical protein